jgi:hypothetical protein
MIRAHFEIRVQQRCPGGLIASAARFDGHKHCVNLIQRFPVVELHHPAFLRGIVLEKHSELESLRAIRTSAAPGLKCTRFF